MSLWLKSTFQSKGIPKGQRRQSLRHYQLRIFNRWRPLFRLFTWPFIRSFFAVWHCNQHRRQQWLIWIRNGSWPFQWLRPTWQKWFTGEKNTNLQGLSFKEVLIWFFIDWIDSYLTSFCAGPIILRLIILIRCCRRCLWALGVEGIRPHPKSRLEFQKNSCPCPLLYMGHQWGLYLLRRVFQYCSQEPGHWIC
jgi:hypothetical protein